MFKRKKTEGSEPPVFAPRPTASTPAQPAMPAEAPAEDVVERTTCYPQDGGAPPRVVGEPRTTVYRQAIPWSRRGYDTVN